MQRLGEDIPKTGNATRPRRRAQCVALLILLALFLLAWLLAPRELSLTDPRLPHVKAPNANFTETFFWDDANRLCWFGIDGAWQFNPSMKRVPDELTPYKSLTFPATFEIDVNNPGSAQASLRHSSAQAILSPDGRRAIVLDSVNGTNVRDCWSEGTKVNSAWKSMSDCYDLCWLPDSRRCVGLVIAGDNSVRMCISNVEQPGRPAQFLYEQHVDPATISLIGAYGPNEVALLRWLDAGQTSYEVTVAAVSPRFSVLRRVASKLPPNVQPATFMAFSSKSQRLAWRIVCASATSAWQRFISRVMRRPIIAHEELWVSNMDGTNWRKIGNLENSSDKRQIDAVKWLPDGKHLSVLIEDTIWIVPAD